ncbi:MAG: AAA family ATPase [Bacteroidota bacterium]
MDLQYFLNILFRRKWLILTAVLLSALAAYFLIDRQEDKYKSTAVLATGIVDITGLNPDSENPWIQQFYVDMGFGNLIELMTSQRNVAFLSYRLLLHDLGPNGINAETPFRTLPPEKELDFRYNEAQIEEFKSLLSNKLDSLKFTLDNPIMERMYKDLSKAYGYDYEGMMSYNLKVERKGDTDLMNIDFVSENPKLSTYAANTFCKDFLKNYQLIQQEEEYNSVLFFDGQVDEKKAMVDSLRRQLRFYLDNRNLADLDGQRQAVISQIKELENTKQENRQKIPALKKSIQEYNRYLAENNKRSTGDKAVALVNNKAIANLKKQIEELQNKWIASGYTDEKIKRRLDLTRKNRDERIVELSKMVKDDDDDTVKEREENLLKQRIDLEVELAEAESSVQAIDRALIDMRIKANSFVSDEDFVRRLEQELKIAEREYEEVYADYSREKRNLDNSTLPVQIFEYAQMPERPESKQKAIISAFSGIIGGTFASVLVFFLAFVDYSVNSPHKFKKFTGLNLLGSINRIKTKKLDLAQLFSGQTKNEKMQVFREAIRNLRFTLENSGGKTFLFTSTKAQEGKTFLIITLAHSLTLKNKKVLLVDTNFKHNELTQMSKESMQDNLLNSRLLGESRLDEEFESKKINSHYNFDNVDIIGNKGSFNSPSEVFADKDFKQFIKRISNNYDYVFMESAPMNQYSDTKELIDFADKVVAVFSADTQIKQKDKESIEFLKGLGDRFLGAILNKIDLKNLG